MEESTGDRVRLVRKAAANRMTLEEFAQRLGVTKVSISRIENGVRGLTSQMSKAISREFGVNEEWLETGKGEMYNYQTVTTCIGQLTEEYGLNHLEAETLKEVLDMPKGKRNITFLLLRQLLREAKVSEDQVQG